MLVNIGSLLFDILFGQGTNGSLFLNIHFLLPVSHLITRKLPGSCCLMKTMKTKTISVCMTLPNLGIIMLPSADENRSFARSLFFYKIYSEYYSSY